jgi:hypothetical protein
MEERKSPVRVEPDARERNNLSVFAIPLVKLAPPCFEDFFLVVLGNELQPFNAKDWLNRATGFVSCCKIVANVRRNTATVRRKL